MPVLVLAAVAALSGCRDALAPIPEATDLLDRLNQVPGVTAREIPSAVGFGRAFELDILQPLDHDHPGGAAFRQRAYLTHTGESDPMVFAPNGYAANWGSSQELGVILRTNTLHVTHRFFVDSEPDPMDWRYLDIRQSAADHHRIVTLLKQVYTGKWISVGASKSGETVLFHRRFHPGDVDASVVYVAPLIFSPSDPRFQPFLDAIGTSEDRAALRAFQRRLLLARDSLLGRFASWYPANGHTLSLPAGPVFEGEVMGYEWAYWQYRRAAIKDIPGPNATYDQMLAHLALVSGIDGSSDRNRYFYRPYVYQAFTEIGYPARSWPHLEDLLAYLPISLHQEYGFPPDLRLEYNYLSIPDILQWVQTQGNNIVLLYGGADPWTAGAIELTGQTNAIKLIKPGGSHRVRLADFSERNQVLATLGQWVGLDLLARVTWPVVAPALRDPREGDLFVAGSTGGR
jgi:hypothetical protein